jgi:4'-phosphopantetheinyl transferase
VAVHEPADAPWAPGPSRPLLADGEVHVWRAELTTVADELRELLSGDERARAARFVSDRDGELWRRARGLLRELLGRYLGCDPRSLRFAKGEHGKPALVHGDEGGARAPAFNMSHSEHLALYAFSAAGAVGVDVEVERHPVDEVALASRMLGAAEAQRLEALEPEARRREFLRAWARHEAELKCLGVGIGGADRAAEQRLWVNGLEMGPDVGAAVAAERPAREVRCWEWPG